MKKIIILILSAGIFTATNAQGNKAYSTRNDQYEQNTYGRNNNNLRNKDVYRTSSFQKQKQVEKINREFKYKLVTIQQNRYMTNMQKRLSIRDAKNERNHKIKMLNKNFNRHARNYGRK